MGDQSVDVLALLVQGVVCCVTLSQDLTLVVVHEIGVDNSCLLLLVGRVEDLQHVLADEFVIGVHHHCD